MLAEVRPRFFLSSPHLSDRDPPWRLVHPSITSLSDDTVAPHRVFTTPRGTGGRGVPVRGGSLNCPPFGARVSQQVPFPFFQGVAIPEVQVLVEPGVEEGGDRTAVQPSPWTDTISSSLIHAAQRGCTLSCLLCKKKRTDGDGDELASVKIATRFTLLGGVNGRSLLSLGNVGRFPLERGVRQGRLRSHAVLNPLICDRLRDFFERASKYYSSHGR